MTVIETLPNGVRLVTEKIGTVRVLTTDSVWHGMTYAADLDEVRAAIAAMHRDGSYPTRFWER